MKKLLAIISAVAIFSSQTVYAKSYYTERERKEISSDDLVYTEYDTEVISDIINEIDKNIKTTGNDELIKTLIYDAYDEYVKANDGYTLATIYSNLGDITPDNATKAYIVCTDVIELLSGMIEDVYKSDYKYLLEDIIGDRLDELIDSIPSEKSYELIREQGELLEQYTNSYGNSDECADIFIELVKLRNEYAKENGYDNFAEYSYEEYGRDYTADEVKEFSDAVSEYIMPVFLEFFYATTFMDGFYIPGTEYEVKEITSAILNDINDELGESFDYMLDNNLYDISFSDKKDKSAGSYTINLIEPEVPYLFENPVMPYDEDISEGIKTLIHETGHYCAMLNDPCLDKPWYPLTEMLSIDTAEVQSQGLELLCQKYYPPLFGSGTPFELYNSMSYTLSALIDGCFLHEWQTRIYETDNLTVDECNAIAVELMIKYYGSAITLDEAQEYWTAVHHNFNSPMYYISYALSGAAALQLYAESVNDYDLAVDKYMNLSALGCYVPFKESLKECGLGNVFDTDTIKNTADVLKNTFAMNYDDVVSDSWYNKYIYTTSMYFDGIDETHFAPDTNITRGDFVKLIGGMYEYYIGFDKEYSENFTDVSDTSEYAKYIGWAYENGVVDGYTQTQFGPDDLITREQLVAVMHRLAKLSWSDENITGDNAAADFSDINEVSSWARESMDWAVKHGIINGRDNNMLVPLSNATRAESAKIASMYVDFTF